ncbi:hypothetical protein [Kineococcus terrestris]|uniref:hypothetical protein n=1 Tax=Kineococcus terrestris TaxID=2044856 RepID=UPI0034DAD61A
MRAAAEQDPGQDPGQRPGNDTSAGAGQDADRHVPWRLLVAGTCSLVVGAFLLHRGLLGDGPTGLAVLQVLGGLLGLATGVMHLLTCWRTHRAGKRPRAVPRAR